MRATLWERESELRTLGAALAAAARGEGGLVVIDGPAGVGKSRLLQAARELAGEHGVPVFGARSVELERGVPFGLARRLFAPTLLRRTEAERAQLLSGPAAPAGRLIADPGASLGDTGAGTTIDGLFWLALNLAGSADRGDAPALAILIDDAQWADRSSLRFLLHAVSAMDDVALCVIVAVRTDELEAPLDLLNRLRAHPGCVRLTPAVLSEAAVEAVVRSADFTDPDPEFSHACARATGGNPFLLVELLTVLAADGVAPTAQAARLVNELLPESVLHAVLVSLARLPEAATALAAAVAVLDQASLPMAAELAGLDLGIAEDAADLLVQAHLLAPGRSVSLAHPLIAASVRADLRPLARARLHRRAAEILEAAGAGNGRVAGHLLHTDPRAEPWVSARLSAAGRDALRGGEFDSAVTLLRRALDEPPTEAEHIPTLIDLAKAEAAADTPHASARLGEALSHVAEPRERADILAQLSRLRFFTGDIAGAADAAERGLAEVDPADDRARLLLSAYLTAATFDPRLRPNRIDRLAPHVERARLGEIPDDPIICAHLGARMAISGEPAAVVAPVVERALSAHPLIDDTSHGIALALPVVALVMLDDLDRAERALAAATAWPHARDSLITTTVVEHWSAVVAYRRGDLIGARAHAQRAVAACDTDDWRLYDGWINSNLAHIALDLGDTDAAVTVLTGLDAVDPIGRCLVLEARAHLAAVQNEPAAAHDLYAEAGRNLDAMGLMNPGFIAWRSPAAIAAARAGRGDDASRLAATDLAIARRTGTARTIGLALRAAALVADRDDAIRLLTESVTVLERSAGVLEYARSLLALGSALRRTNRQSEARMVLEQALDITARAGAEPLMRHVTDELLTTGRRPRRAYLTGVESLTATERRIAEMAAAGETNAEIARGLYIATKTVEWHLANVYRKLDLANRRQLAATIATAPA